MKVEGGQLALCSALGPPATRLYLVCVSPCANLKKDSTSCFVAEHVLNRRLQVGNMLHGTMAELEVRQCVRELIDVVVRTCAEQKKAL